MNLKFVSKIEQDGKKNKIDFIAPVEITSEQDFQIFEFREPSQNVMNRIEVSKNKVNIFAGITSINLVLDKENKIEYTTPNGSIFFDANLHLLEKKQNLIKFNYSLSQNKKIIGKYNITLEIQKV